MTEILEVVLNRTAGLDPAGPDPAALAQLFAAVGRKARVRHCEPATLRPTLTALRDAGPERVVVGGGDGTLSAAADVLAGSDTALGVLPLGTFNNFARDLGIPLETERAVSVLADGRIRVVDLGEVNGRVFINNASLGLYPYTVRRRLIYQRQYGLSKLPAMAYAMLGALWRLPTFRTWIMTEEHEIRVRTPFLFIGNNRYVLEPGALFRRLALTEGRLSVFYTRKRSRLGLLLTALQVLVGGPQRVPALEYRWVRQVRIQTHRAYLKLALDGEVVRQPCPLLFRIRPQALKVVCPPGAL